MHAEFSHEDEKNIKKKLISVPNERGNAWTWYCPGCGADLCKQKTFDLLASGRCLKCGQRINFE